MIAAAATLATAAALTAATAATAPAAADTGYTWDNVEVVGGGFVPGIVFNQSEPGLAYARTDIGGAYRWNPSTERWVPILDHVGWDDWSHSGVVSIATDPVDPDRVYAATGTYTNDWDPNNGAIKRSDDRGETWRTTELPFKLGGNMPGRGMGERLAVDPNDNSVLYFGAPSGHGLWRSTDHGATWAEVGNFPNPGNYVADPSDPGGYSGDNQGVVWVTFDPGSASAGQVTQDVYVGVADKENTVYRSTDGGSTWERVPGQPTGFLAQKGVLDHENGQLYIATSDTGGPYDGSDGEVWRYDVAGGSWTEITPPENDGFEYGFSGLAVDRQDPDTIMVVSQLLWWPDIRVFRSTDRGATWSQLWEFAGYPDRTLRYELDHSGAPWLDFNKQPNPPEPSPKLGWMTQSLEIDPFDSDRMMYGTGATVYGSDNLTEWDSGGTIDIEVRAQGLEETAVQDLMSPPSGPPLVSGLGDIGGFVHEDLDVVPDSMFDAPFHGNTRSVDFAELAPATMVRVGEAVDGEVDSHIGVSTSSGSSWWAGQEPSGVTGAGTVAVNADGSRVLWSPDGTGVHHSTTLGSSWTASTGVPAGARVEADRVDPDTFYAVAGGGFYTSTDGGATFTESAAAGLPAEGNVRFGAVPGHEGDVWLAGGAPGGAYGMWRSTDAGATFTRIADVDEGDSVGFGKAAPGGSYPAVYTSSRINGVRGIFRSDDAGETWTRVNDDRHQWAWTGAAITGDPRVYGRVYVGTNGRGIIVGDLAEQPAPDPSGEPSPDPSGEPSGEPSPDPDAACSVSYTVTGEWQGGFQGQVDVTNTGDALVDGWELEWAFPGDQRIGQAWGAEVTQDGADVTASNAGWNGHIVPGGTVGFGFLGTGGAGAGPDGFVLNGQECSTS
ncbi:cellulose binding domain-containing protein [Actinorugispora endophytica]|uniref:Cellulose binding domain-containing protein n=1 Tax=Actinorugispora endophytica TaxID=1605990 RepID=A0A4R6UXW2_9ACTN|nr:cellulose binding domain-containing protein [Actinorugispora endophytica]TDQ50773.1 cellulose binding domain-containing protein [Actinorugispora endophytica]